MNTKRGCGPRGRRAHPAGDGGSAGALFELGVGGEALPDDVGRVVLGTQPWAAFEDEVDEEKLDSGIESWGKNTVPLHPGPATVPICSAWQPHPQVSGRRPGPQRPPGAQVWDGGPAGLNAGQGKLRHVTPAGGIIHFCVTSNPGVGLNQQQNQLQNHKGEVKENSGGCVPSLPSDWGAGSPQGRGLPQVRACVSQPRCPGK